MKPNKWPSSYTKKIGKSDFERYINIFENQFIVCLILVGIAFILKAIDIPIANTIMNGTKSVLNYNMDYENTKKGLQLVFNRIPRIKDDVIKVFSNKTNNYTEKSTKTSMLSMVSPISGKIIASFGSDINPLTGNEKRNDGIDIEAKSGDAVKAAFEGSIMLVDNANLDYGKIVVIQHPNDVRTVYGYLSKIDVKTGDKVKTGQTIGIIGSSSKTGNAKLHFEIWENKKPVDPLLKVNITGSSNDVK